MLRVQQDQVDQRVLKVLQEQLVLKVQLDPLDQQDLLVLREQLVPLVHKVLLVQEERLVLKVHKVMTETLVVQHFIILLNQILRMQIQVQEI